MVAEVAVNSTASQSPATDSTAVSNNTQKKVKSRQRGRKKSKKQRAQEDAKRREVRKCMASLFIQGFHLTPILSIGTRFQRYKGRFTRQCGDRICHAACRHGRSEKHARDARCRRKHPRTDVSSISTLSDQ